MRRAATGIAGLLAAAALAQVIVLAQAVPETFTATASVTGGGTSASAPVAVTITRYGSDAEREVVMTAVRDGGTAGARTALEAMSDAGFIQLGDHRTAIKFAAQRTTPSGRLVTVVTAGPILFLGAALPKPTPRPGFDVGVAMLDVGESTGLGELVPAAKVGLDESGALLIEDYGATVVWLNGLARAR